MADRRYRDREFLCEQYVVQRRPARVIAEDCGVTSSTVHRWLARHDVERTPRYRQPLWLHEQYVEQGKTQQAIARECGVAETTICHWLGRHGITGNGAFARRTCDACGDEFRYYPSVRDAQYCSNGCAQENRKRQVEVTCPNCGDTFSRRASLDTEYCSMACWGADLETYGEEHYRGIWLQQRQRALERDNYQCVVCGISNEEHRRITGRALDVHHRVPVRLFARWEKPPADAHALRNLVTVCVSHHPDRPGTLPDHM